MFALAASATLYDLTNTYFEGAAAANPKAAQERSKEKRSDCPLVTLGVVCDGSGFIPKTSVQSADDADYAEKTAEWPAPMAHPTGDTAWPGNALIHLR